MAKQVSINLKEVDHGWKDIKKSIDQMKHCYTTVGVHEDAGEQAGTPLAVIASVHEYGAEIKNGFGKGIHITIPERSFMRSWVAENGPDIGHYKERLINQVMEGKLSVIIALARLGEYAVSGIKRKIVNGPFTPLKPATIAKKGSSKPLIDTGQMIGSITHKEVLGREPPKEGA